MTARLDMVRVAPRLSLNLRCSFCHGDAVDAVACSGCRTLTHPACKGEAGSCPTLGCGTRRLVRVELAAQPTRGNRVLLVVLLLIASCLVWAAVTPMYGGPPRKALTEEDLIKAWGPTAAR